MSIAVKSTRRAAPVRALIHGDGGVGKSTLAASAPLAIFIAAEDGLKNIDAQAVDPPPRTWADVLEAIDHLAALPVSECRTIAIDSLDWIEPLCWSHVCVKGKKPDIESFGYGKGYAAALDEWRVFLRKLETVSASGKNVILIAHSVRKPVKNPEGDDYEKWQIKLHEKASGLLKEWVDVVGFAAHEIVVDDSSGRAKGMSTGKRVLRTQPNAAYDAKTRYSLPRTIPLDWTSFEAAIRAGSVSPVERLKSELESKMADLNDSVVENGARAFLDERGVNVGSLTEAIATVDAYLSERRKAG